MSAQSLLNIAFLLSGSWKMATRRAQIGYNARRAAPSLSQPPPDVITFYLRD
jgi:hypothetical protein